jgi:hypothetical protein
VVEEEFNKIASLSGDISDDAERSSIRRVCADAVSILYVKVSLPIINQFPELSIDLERGGS